MRLARASWAGFAPKSPTCCPNSGVHDHGLVQSVTGASRVPSGSATGVVQPPKLDVVLSQVALQLIQTHKVVAHRQRNTQNGLAGHGCGGCGDWRVCGGVVTGDETPKMSGSVHNCRLTLFTMPRRGPSTRTLVHRAAFWLPEWPQCGLCCLSPSILLWLSGRMTRICAKHLDASSKLLRGFAGIIFVKFVPPRQKAPKFFSEWITPFLKLPFV
jgi:hypothetical protein